jgi:hypothetical protein
MRSHRHSAPSEGRGRAGSGSDERSRAGSRGRSGGRPLDPVGASNERGSAVRRAVIADAYDAARAARRCPYGRLVLSEDGECHATEYGPAQPEGLWVRAPNRIREEPTDPPAPPPLLVRNGCFDPLRAASQATSIGVIHFNGERSRHALRTHKATVHNSEPDTAFRADAQGARPRTEHPATARRWPTSTIALSRASRRHELSNQPAEPPLIGRTGPPPHRRSRRRPDAR